MQKREKENAAMDILGENKKKKKCSLSYGVCASCKSLVVTNANG